MNIINPEVDLYLKKVKKWQQELSKLRTIVLDCQLTEELKWKQPCYTFQNSNVVLIAGFKDNCSMSFFKGVLLNDSNNILEAPGENSQSVRMIKFTNLQEIIEKESILQDYIYEAIEVEKAGLKVELKKSSELEIIEELQNKLDKNPALKTAFEALTPGRQRGYLLYFSAPKQSKTRETRIEKYIEKILSGKGFYDCTCGLSKKLPTCDGSHKYIK